jgi:2-keto-3-deoxy-L-rhamnonate aldolase RhmA|tara:strand:- start:13277 stop:14044 length:768 start_codon:yes stop_codon:yes gene_type:complete
VRRSKTLEKLKNNELVKICALGHFMPFYVAHAAQSGFDAIWLDAEHRAWNTRELQAIMAYCHQYDIDCMMRPASIDKVSLYRQLEDGAAGMLVPHVNDVERATYLRDCLKFPPLGDRGIDSVGQDNGFMFTDVNDYTDKANENTFLICQIETAEALENAEAIISTDGVDGVFVGPGDMQLRITKNNLGFTLEEAIEKVAALCQQYGKAWGLPVSDVATGQKRYQQGARLLAYGGEFVTLVNMLNENSKGMDEMIS